VCCPNAARIEPTADNRENARSGRRLGRLRDLYAPLYGRIDSGLLQQLMYVLQQLMYVLQQLMYDCRTTTRNTTLTVTRRGFVTLPTYGKRPGGKLCPLRKRVFEVLIRTLIARTGCPRTA
jgi:hypothetical protein